jgi:hypothetical protein
VHQVKLHDHRVLAVRLGVIEQADEVRVLWEAMRAELLTTKGLVVATADFRLGMIYPPEVTEGLLGILKADNPRVERSAHIIGPSAILGLQIERIVREAGKPSRRIFRSVPDALAFLGPMLTPSQSAWLEQWYETLPSGAQA